MESSYGIGVQNRFELFYNDDAHPLDFLKLKQSKKSLKNDETAEKENQGKAKTKDSLSGKKPLKSDVGIKSFNENDSRYGNQEVGGRQLKSSSSHPDHDEHKLRNNERVKFSDREERNNRRNEPAERRENRDTHEGGGVPQRFDGEARGGGRGSRGFSSGPYRGRGARRGGRGGPGGFSGGDFRGKREFDRQSGMVTSGVKAFDKRDGAGPYNWGSDKDQIEEQMQGDLSTDGETAGNSDKAQGEDGSPATDDAQRATDDAQRDEEAAQREMTLDEWKALQKREKPIFKTRLPGEGENTAQWKKTYVLKKKEEEKNATSDEEDNGEEEEETHHGRKKVLLPIDFQFADTPSRGRGRGRGRGGPGGRGRGMGGFNGGGGRGFSGGGSRGMGGVGGGRGGRGGPPHARSQAANRQEAPKMDDERDFPSLG